MYIRPIPYDLLVASEMWIDMLAYIVNLCVTTGQFPLKSAVKKRLLKKPTLDPHKTIGLCLIYYFYIKLLKRLLLNN